MKPCRKLREPDSLANYRQAQPEATWDNMRDDPYYGGQQAYRDIKRTVVRGQRCLCAFCETRIAEGTSDDEIDRTRDAQRVEHFHPKDDTARPPNWALHWPNLWAVCLGGSRRPPAGEPINPNDFMRPLPDNLSCDAFKDHQIREGELPEHPEGWVLAPNEIPAFPILFKYSPECAPEPHPENCAAITLPHNNYADTLTMVASTIRHLNLGCTRLNRNRRIALSRLEKEIEKVRLQSRGAKSADVLLHFARRKLSQNPVHPWAEYFTLIRWRLATSAEQHLQEIQFAG